MSWDLFAFNIPPDINTIEDIPDDLMPIGQRAELISKFIGAIPEADFSEPSWGILRSANWLIEINLGDEEETMGFALHVRGGDEAVGAVSAILDCVGARALDSGTGELFVSGPGALDGFRAWRSYRDDVVATLSNDSDQS
jgi:hypothetical protein